MSLTKIGSIGINTGIAFAGVTTIVTLNTANDALSIGSTVNVGSGITLGASGDIFATGVSTVTTLKVGSGVTLSSDGDVFFTGIATGNGSGLTALNASNIGSGTVPTARLGSGTASSSTFLRGDSTFQTVNTDLVSDTSPQLGGDLDTNGNNISFDDNDQLRLGNATGGDIVIKHTTSDNNGHIENHTGDLLISTKGAGDDVIIEAVDDVQIKVQGGETAIDCIGDGAVKLYHDGSVKLETSSLGVISPYFVGVDDAQLRLGDSGDFIVYHDGTTSRIHSASHPVAIRSGGTFGVYNGGGTETLLTADPDGAVKLYYDNDKMIETFDYGFIIPNATGNLGIQWGPSSNNYCNIWAEYGSGDLFLAGGLKPKTTNAGFFSSYASNFSRNAIQVDAFGNGGIHFYASAPQNVAKDSAITVNEIARVNQHGLTFNGDSASANALDDYEEGTWTPSLYNGGSPSYSQQTGLYTKVGNLVRLTFNLIYTGATTSNQARIQGLPFTYSSTFETTTNMGRMGIVWNDNKSGGSRVLQAVGHTGTGTAMIYVDYLLGSNAATDMSLRGTFEMRV